MNWAAGSVRRRRSPERAIGRDVVEERVLQELRGGGSVLRLPHEHPIHELLQTQRRPAHAHRTRRLLSRRIAAPTERYSTCRLEVVHACTGTSMSNRTSGS